MIEEALKEELQAVRMAFPTAFITLDWELITVPKLNIWILLDNVVDVRQVKVKMLAWMSCYCFEGDVKWRKKILLQMNKYLQADFTADEMRLISNGLKAVRDGIFENRHYLFAFGGYDFKYLDE